MTGISTIDPLAKPAKTARPSRAKAHTDADLDLVSGYKLAAHLGMSRQNVDSLAVQGVLTRRADGLFDQTASRLAYLKHLRSERRGSASTAAQAEYAKQKARLIQLKVARQEGELMETAEHRHFIDQLCGLFLSRLSGFAVRIGGRDLAARRVIDQAVYDLRLEISEAASKLADQSGEPLDGDDDDRRDDRRRGP